MEEYISLLVKKRLFFSLPLHLTLPFSMTKNGTPSSSEMEWANVFGSNKHYIAKVPASMKLQLKGKFQSISSKQM